MMSRRKKPIDWPPGQYFALTYTIPPHFGGLTKAMLQRSWNFGQITGHPVQVLTVDLVPNLDDVRADLVDRGELPNAQLLRNLWEELCQLNEHGLRALGPDPTFAPPEPIDTAAKVVAGHHDALLVRKAPDGSTDVEIRRRDGTILARQRWIRGGLRPAVTSFGDTVTDTYLWSSDGQYLGGWPGTWSLWRAWISLVVGDDPAHLVIDSATVADAFAEAAIPHTSVSVVIHNNHIDAVTEPPYGPLGRWRRHLMERRDGFDAIVFLTERQRHDAALLLGTIPQAHVIPNALAGTTAVRGVDRDECRGVALASLDGRKRLEHAVHALAKTSGTTLHVHGTGPRAESLQTMIASIGAPVHLDGHTTEPARQFAASSYSLLTSTNEGLPLVLAEAMREGCVPIAYDIAYGPSDVITDGVDGFLVPAGDHQALAAAITDFLDAPRRRRRAMRRAARSRAADFAPGPIATRWADTLRDATRRRAAHIDESPDPAKIARNEQLAMITRFGEPRLHINLTHVRWDSTATFDLEFAAKISVGPLPVAIDVTIERLVVELVHRPTGRRTPLATTFTGTTYSAMAELHLLNDPLDHVILVTAQTPDAVLVDTVRELAVWGPWSSSPPVGSDGIRPVLELRRDGLALGTARPAVVGQVTLGEVLQLTAQDLAGHHADAFELSANSQPTRTVPVISGAALVPANELASGRWRVRARVSGRWHDVAWSGETGDLPGRADERTRVRLTPRGYVRLDVRDDHGLLTNIDLAAATLSGTLSGQLAPQLAGILAQVNDSGGWHLGLSSVPVGRHRLTLDGNGPDIEADDFVQARLPLTIVTSDRTIKLRRRGRRDAYEVDVTVATRHIAVIKNTADDS